MKRILIFSITYHPFIGGAEIALKELTDRMSDYEFHMVTLRNDSTLLTEEKVGNIHVHRIGLATEAPSAADLARFPLQLNKYLYQFLAVFHALTLHRAYRFDGIWAMMAHAAGIPAGMFKVLNPSVPYLLTLQEGDPPEHIERIARPVWPLFVQGFRKADQLQAISTFLLAWGKRRGFKGEGLVIPNGVDTNAFAQTFSPEEIAQTKQALGKKEGDIFLITTSRLVHKNGIDTVIDALTLLPENVRFLVVGTGAEEGKLKARAHWKGVERRVDFRGHVPHHELPHLLAASDIFIRPSRSEGMGNSFIEAMAAGLPVIATQEGGIADFLFDAVRNPDRSATGWAVDKENPEQIATAVTEILGEPERTRAVVETARTMALGQYSWDTSAARMQEVFRNLLVQ